VPLVHQALPDNACGLIVVVYYEDMH
jgi:hypothetical protein